MQNAAKVILAVRDRRVVRTMAVYAGAAWLLLQVLGFFGSIYSFPRQVFDTAAFLALVGAGCAAVIGWYHGERGSQKLVRTEIILLLLLGLVGAAGTYRILTRSPVESVYRLGVVLVVELPITSEEEASKAFYATYDPPDAARVVNGGWLYEEPTNLDMTLPGGSITVRQNPVWVSLAENQPLVRVVIGLREMPVLEEMSLTGPQPYEADSLVFTTRTLTLRLSRAVSVTPHPDSLVIRLRKPGV